MAAKRVARLMRSGKLVRLPLASACLTASISSLGGRRKTESLKGFGDAAFLIDDGSTELAASCAPSMLSVVKAAPTVGSRLEDSAPVDDPEDPSRNPVPS